MKLRRTQLSLLAALSCGILSSCGPAPVSSFVVDVIRAPFVALGAASSAVRATPAAVTATATSVNETANSIGPAGSKLVQTTYQRAGVSTTTTSN